MRWVLVVAAAAVVASIAVLGLAAPSAGVLPPLDQHLIDQAAGAGAVIDQSVPGTAECWAASPLPAAGRLGPLARCRGVVAPQAALALMAHTDAHPRAIGLADFSWRPPCTAPCSTTVGAHRRLAWLIQVDAVDELPGYHGVGPSCGPVGSLYVVEAATGAPVMSLAWSPEYASGGVCRR